MIGDPALAEHGRGRPHLCPRRVTWPISRSPRRSTRRWWHVMRRWRPPPVARASRSS